MNIDREGRFDLSSVKHLTGDIPKVVEKGDVLFNNTNSPELIGKTTVIPTEEPMGFSNHMTRIRLEAGLSPSFSARQLHFLWMAGYFLHRCKNHVNQASIAAEPLAHTVPFALPPLREQECIADTLDELLSDLDSGVAALERVQKKLKHYRAAVLKAAVEGDLTADWRAQHPDTEPASDLLTRILTERRRRWEEDQLRKFKEAGKEPPKNWKAKYKSPARPSGSASTRIPGSWAWTGFEQLSDGVRHALKAGPFGSALKKEFYCERGFKIYGQEQVIKGDAFFGDYFINASRFNELISCAVKPGDILISLVGTTGKVLVLPEDCAPGIINPRLLKLTLLPEHTLSAYIKLVLEGPQARAFFKAQAHGGTMDVLNLGILKCFPIPLPPIDEQEAIVEAVEDQLSVIEHLEADIEAKLKSAQGLRQSLLRHAFTGQLVPQDPNDEPASELLKRIAKEREERARLATEAKVAARKSTAAKGAKRATEHLRKKTQKVSLKASI